MERRAMGVEVLMPTLFEAVVTVRIFSLPALSRTSRAKAEVVAILKGSTTMREAYSLPRASMVVVPEASVVKER